MTDMHGTSDEGVWIAYAPNSVPEHSMSGKPEATYGPFKNRAEAEAFVAPSRGTPYPKAAVNLSDYPDFFGPGGI